MRSIAKRAEPRELGAWRAANPSVTDWNSLGAVAKDAVQSALVEDQAGLCAYCQKRITLDRLRIEHWLAREPSRARPAGAVDPTFEWSNLLGVCHGLETGQPKTPPGLAGVSEWTPTLDNEHCDRKRGAKPLHLHPVEYRGDLSAKFRYLGNGCIAANDAHAVEDIETLNLNSWRLCEGRKAVIEALHRMLATVGDRRATVAECERMLRIVERADASGQLPEFVETARYVLGRRIRAG